MFLLLWLAIGLAFGGVESPAAAHNASGYDSVMMLDAHADHANMTGTGIVPAMTVAHVMGWFIIIAASDLPAKGQVILVCHWAAIPRIQP